MRRDRSRWQQFVLVSLTIICALAVGYVTALLTGGEETSSLAANLAVPISDTAVAETATATVLAASPIASTATATATARAATATPTVRPITPTPEITATAEIAAEPELFVLEDFDGETESFLTRETETWSAGVVDGRYQLMLNGQRSIGFTTALPEDSYRLSFDVALDQGGAGMVFLFAEPAITYRILITPDGAYALERQEGVEASPLVDWTASPALQRGADAVNQIQIEREGQQVRFFANDQLLTTYTIEPGPLESRYGFVLTSKSGQGRALFDNLRGENLPSP